MFQKPRASYISQNLDIEAYGGVGASGASRMSNLRTSTMMTRGDTLTSGSPLPSEADRLDQGHKMSVGKRLKRIARSWYRRLGIRHIACLILLIFYTILGGIMFYAVEHDHDLEKNQLRYAKYLSARNDAARLVCRKLLENCSASPAALEPSSESSNCVGFLLATLTNYERALEAPPIHNTSKWDLWSAIYFCCTLYTTIGYGNIVCSTTFGRVLTMLYALIGIPILLTTLNELGKSMFKCLLLAVKRCRQTFRCFAKATDNDAANAAPAFVKLNSFESPVLMNSSPKMKKALSIISIAGAVKTSSTGTSNSTNVENLPVLVALMVTVGWIFLCAALFCTWERKWSYFESIYFFFISLTTIGLGDVVPEHPRYMTIAYGLVVVGLSLVSMSISVIQNKIEQLYYQFLQRLLEQYHMDVTSGQSELDANVNMMRFLVSNPRARYLMPLLSKNAKQTVAQKFTEESKARGITVPALLQQVHPVSGLPLIVSLAKDSNVDFKEEPKAAESVIATSLAVAKTCEAAVMTSGSISSLSSPSSSQQHLTVETTTAKVEKKPSLTVSAPYDQITQTEIVHFDDKLEQTSLREIADTFVQTIEWASQTGVEDACQTLTVDTDEQEAQTTLATTSDEEAQTLTASFKQTSVQTGKVSLQDQELQTHLFDAIECETQCEKMPHHNQWTQCDEMMFDEEEPGTPDGAGPSSSVRPAQLFLPRSECASVSGGSEASASKGPKINVGKQIRRLFARKLRKRKRKVGSIRHRPLDRARSASPIGNALPRSQTSKNPPQRELLYRRSIAPDFRRFIGSFADIERALSEDSPADRRRTGSATSIRRLSTFHVNFDGGPEAKKGGSNESSRSASIDLQWNPVDGMHAEKQRKVSTLKAMFEKKK